MILVQWENRQSNITAHSGADITAARGALSEVGARLSDVFGYDAIIWVEGETEAICFPKFAKSDSRAFADRIGYVAIINAGDLIAKRRNPELAWRPYERLSQQSALMRQTIAFSLDRQGQHEQEMRDLRKRSNGRVHFLPHEVARSAPLPERQKR